MRHLAKEFGYKPCVPVCSDLPGIYVQYKQCNVQFKPYNVQFKQYNIKDDL